MGFQKNSKKRKNDAVTECNPKFSDQMQALDIGFISWNLIGAVGCIVSGLAYAYIICQIHETRMFFTGIMEVEREISFRTENGLYYSYYKQLVKATSFFNGLRDLTRDGLTEHPGVVNVLSRMNVYQEVLLASAYRFLPFVSSLMEPIFFYVYFVFALHAMLVSALYAMAWLVSGTWLAGCLAVLFYALNGPDVTRVESYMALRENFSLPFLWVQLFVVTVYFKPSLQDGHRKICEKALMVSTFFFALMWQFNQFALLLQAMALFGCQALGVVENGKILHMYACQLASMLVVSVLQFCNTMILSGFLISFILASIVVMKIGISMPEKVSPFDSLPWRIISLLLNTLSVFVVAFIINYSLKTIFRQEADEHINRFLLTKFGFNSSIDFDVRLYLCNGGFNFISWDFFERLTSTFVFPLYAVAHAVLLVLLGLTFFFGGKSLPCPERSKTENVVKSESPVCLSPELAYHCIQMIFFGAVGIMAMRMKYFWTPYMCVFASACLLKPEPWSWAISKKFKSPRSTQVKLLQTAMGVLFISILSSWLHRDVSKELNDMREFYDPDTVELMNWIDNNTEEKAAFSGSMQLMAGVKLCTGRPITNHPHYEDKALRQKTKELYKYYGRHSAEEVHGVLKGYRTDYIILEDSICLVQLRDGCGLPYIMDMEAGLELDSVGRPLRADVLPRFCDEVRRERGDSEARFFSLVLENKTFRVYKVL